MLPLDRWDKAMMMIMMMIVITGKVFQFIDHPTDSTKGHKIRRRTFLEDGLHREPHFGPW